MLNKLLIVLALTVGSIMAPTVLAAETNAQKESVILYVNINTDSAQKLADLLNGVGLTKAQAIVDYRNKNGDFKTIEDLLKVPGIGPATLEKNKQALTVETTTKG